MDYFLGGSGGQKMAIARPSRARLRRDRENSRSHPEPPPLWAVLLAVVDQAHGGRSVKPTTQGARAFLVLGGCVLAAPWTLQACLVAAVLAILRGWVAWCVRSAASGPALARLNRARRRQRLVKQAQLDQAYAQALRRRGLADTAENRARVRWTR